MKNRQLKYVLLAFIVFVSLLSIAAVAMSPITTCKTVRILNDLIVDDDAIISGIVTGDVTGDLTGNVTGNVTGNLSGATATLTGALTLPLNVEHFATSLASIWG